MIKPPFVYAAGMLRLSRKGVSIPDWRWMLDQMGQVPFYPPNVAGWDDGTAWLSSNSTLARYRAGGVVAGTSIKDGTLKKGETAKQALARARRATGNPWASVATKRALNRYARTSMAGREDQPDHWLAERQRGLRHLLLAGPDAQVC